MGRVFAWKEVRNKTVPSLCNFNEVVEFLRRDLEASSLVVSALMLGSFLRGDHSIRSDVDVLVLYPLEWRGEMMRLLRDLRVRAWRFHVPVEFVSLDTELATTTDHHIAPTFLEHLRMMSRDGGIIKRDPLPLIRSNRDGVLEDTRGYLIHKMRTFEKGESSSTSLSEESRFRMIEKALQFPVYVARKMLHCFGIEMPNGDSKAEVARLYPSLGIEGAGEIFSRVRELDRMYTNVLIDQFACPDRRKYLRAIEKLESAVPLASEFARKNVFALRQPPSLR